MQIIEILVTLLVITFQVSFFIATMRRIGKLGTLFPLFSEGQDAPLTIINVNVSKDTGKVLDNDKTLLMGRRDYFQAEVISKCQKENIILDESMLQILDVTNKYLIKNKGSAADFNLLQSISERIVDNLKGSILANIALPLYIGLMGTFGGVIIGIINIYLDGSFSQVAINGFLGGVFIAMIGSLCGLFLTTVNNSYFYSRARRTCDARKNDYYNFLQSELLPVVSKDMAESLFSLKANLDSFNKEFSNNISSFKGSFKDVNDNINLQKEFIAKLKEIGYNRMVNANIRIFDKLTESAEVFKSFVDYSVTLGNSVKSSSQLTDKLNKLLDRVANFEDTLNNLAGGIKDNENLNGTFINYLNERIQSLKKSSDAILQHINATDINTENFIRTETNKLKSLTAAALQELDEYVLALKSSIPELKDKTVEKINSSFDFEKEKSDLAALINSKREKLDEMVFSNNDSFDNLRLLVNINEGIQKLISVSGTNKSTVPEDSGNDDKLLPKLNQIVNELNKLNKKLRPSIFHPSELFNFIFSKNGYHKQ